MQEYYLFFQKESVGYRIDTYESPIVFYEAKSKAFCCLQGISSASVSLKWSHAWNTLPTLDKLSE